AASFKNMGGTAIVGNYAYQSTDGAIRKIDITNGGVTTLAGSASTTGCTDSSTPASVRFGTAGDLTTDGTYLYMHDSCSSGGGLRKTAIATGATSTLLNLGWQYPIMGVTFVGGYLYITDNYTSSSPGQV